MPVLLIAFAAVAVGAFLLFYKGFGMEFGGALLAAALGTGVLTSITVGSVYFGTLF